MERTAVVAGGFVAASTVGAGLLVLLVEGARRYEDWRRHRLEVGAITQLRGLEAAQTHFRDDDLEQDGLRDYGSLSELVDAGLVDARLEQRRALGGYRFELCRSTSGKRFMVVANSLEPGLRSLAIACSGPFRSDGFALDAGVLRCNDECVLPPRCIPVSR